MNKGDSSDDCFPKFFKVYLPDDAGDDLDIPISFNSYLPKSLPEYVIVRSIYGNVWKMKLGKRCGDVVEKISMVDGWKKIVKDEDLKGGEFLAFEFDGSRLFNFCIYGHATCKRLGSSVKAKEESKDESESEDGKSCVDIIVIDDDDDDQDSGDEDIVVIDDDSTDADDNDDVSSGQGSGMEDQSTKDIIVIDEDTSDEEYTTDGDEDDETRSGVETEKIE